MPYPLSHKNSHPHHHTTRTALHTLDNKNILYTIYLPVLRRQEQYHVELDRIFYILGDGDGRGKVRSMGIPCRL